MTEPAIPHVEIAGVTETTDDNLLPPGAEGVLGEDNITQIARLQEFLQTRFPDEVNRTNRQRPETPIETAIRLLDGLSTFGPEVSRCAEQYCTKPAGHTDAHGVVHYR